MLITSKGAGRDTDFISSGSTCMTDTRFPSQEGEESKRGEKEELSKSFFSELFTP